MARASLHLPSENMVGIGSPLIDRPPETVRSLDRLPTEVGLLLLLAGVTMSLTPPPPGPFDLSIMLSGCLVLWPRGFRAIDGWSRKRFPTAHRAGMRFLDRYLDDLERRYPNSTGCRLSEEISEGDGCEGMLTMPVYCPSCWSEINPGDDSCPHCSYWMPDFDNLSYEKKLLRALAHPVRETRMLAIQLLGELRSTSALPAFNSILRTEEDIYVIREIARSLARIGNDESLDLLETLRSHGSSLVGKLAEELLHEANRSMPKVRSSSMPGPSSC